MKVFILFQRFDLEGDYVQSVHSTKELAEAARDALPKQWRKDYSWPIFQFEVDGDTDGIEL